MTYPTTDVVTTNLDAGGDSPAAARVDLLDLAVKFNQLRDHVSVYGVMLNPGTRMPFAQAAAPTGWTQDTSDNANNRMLRVVNSTGGGVGGSASPILNNVVPAHTHGFTTGTVSADHAHGVSDPGHVHSNNIIVGTSGAGGALMVSNAAANEFPSSRVATNAAGTGISLGGISANHTHSGSTDNGSSSTNWTPRYIDLIICSKN